MQEETKISHEEFKIGIMDGVIGFNIVDNDQFSVIVHKPYIKILDWLFTVLSIGIFVLIPLFAYCSGKWSLLLGFVGYLGGTVIQKGCIAPRQAKKRINRSFIAVISLSILAFVTIYLYGFLNTISFVLACALYEFVVATLWVYFRVEVAIADLVNNADSYYYCVKNNLIEPYYHS